MRNLRDAQPVAILSAMKDSPTPAPALVSSRQLVGVRTPRRRTAGLACGALWLAVAATDGRADEVEYTEHVLPIMQKYCFECHSEQEGETRGSLAFDDLEEVAGFYIGQFGIIRPGDAENSDILKSILLPRGHEDRMPPRGPGLNEEEIEVIQAWIDGGAVIAGWRDAEGNRPEMAEGDAPPATTPTPPGAEPAPTPAPTPPAQPARQLHKWINHEGRQIEAYFNGLDGEHVLLELADGRQHRYPLGQLSPESQGKARQMGAASGD